MRACVRVCVRERYRERDKLYYEQMCYVYLRDLTRDCSLAAPTRLEAVAQFTTALNAHTRTQRVTCLSARSRVLIVFDGSCTGTCVRMHRRRDHSLLPKRDHDLALQ